MPTTSNEIVESRTAEIRGGVMRGVREWRVWETTGIPLTPNDALSDAGLPQEQDEFPGVPGLIRNELITTERIPNNPNMCKVVWDYIGAAFDPTFDLKVEFHSQETAELLPTFRIPKAGAPLGLPIGVEQLLFSNANTADIGGESNDIGGLPQSYLRYKTVINISELVPAVIGGVTIGITHLSGRRGYFFYNGFVGRRNINDFLGFSLGQVLYIGNTSRRLRLNELSLTHTFVADSFFHLVQVADLDSHNDPVLDIRVPPLGPAGVRVAKSVWWRQPFNTFGDFNIISANF